MKQKLLDNNNNYHFYYYYSIPLTPPAGEEYIYLEKLILRNKYRYKLYNVA